MHENSPTYNGVIIPGWNDTRNRDRIRKACEWADLYLSESKPTPIHHKKLQIEFGGRGTPVGKFLRAELLTQVPKSHRREEKSTDYYLKKQNLQLLQSSINSINSSVVHGVIIPGNDEDSSESCNGVIIPGEVRYSRFTYKDKSYRLWHEKQRLETDKKDAYWASQGLPWNYDIVSAAPTILTQLAEMAGLKTKHLIAVQTFLAAPKKFRLYVQKLAGLTPGVKDDDKKAKALVTSLFNGARLARNSYCSAFKMLNKDRARMEALQNDQNVRMLLNNVSSMWAALRLSTQLPLKTGSEKWSLYFQYERAILEIAVQYFNELGIEYFLEHDGYRTSTKIDTEELEARVYRELNLKIRLENK